MYPMGDPYGGGAQPDMTEYKASEGEPLPNGEKVATEEQVVEAMRTVYDPEIPVNIYDLGLIYTNDIAENGNIDITMSPYRTGLSCRW